MRYRRPVKDQAHSENSINREKDRCDKSWQGQLVEKRKIYGRGIHAPVGLVLVQEHPGDLSIVARQSSGFLFSQLRRLKAILTSPKPPKEFSSVNHIKQRMDSRTHQSLLARLLANPLNLPDIIQRHTVLTEQASVNHEVPLRSVGSDDYSLISR